MGKKTDKAFLALMKAYVEEHLSYPHNIKGTYESNGKNLFFQEGVDVSWKLIVTVDARELRNMQKRSKQ